MTADFEPPKYVQSLIGALLPGAQMQLATLAWTHLQGADLRYAELRGANLDNAKLQGADLREIRLWQTSINSESNLGLADLRGASWQPLRDDETARLSEMIGASQAGDCWAKHMKLTLALKIAVGAWSDDPPEFALDGILLVDDVEDPRWQRLNCARLTADEHVYDEALVSFLADLARSDPHVARGLASRIGAEEPGRAGSPAACSTGRDRRCPRTSASACPGSPRNPRCGNHDAR